MIRLNALRLSSSERTILKDVTFAMQAQEVVALMAPSGTGKSLLGRFMARQLGPEISALSDAPVVLPEQSKILLVPQNVRAQLNGQLSIARQIELSLPNHASPKDQHAALIALGFADSDRILASRPSELSSGMCQRVLLAIAVLRAPDFLILDEPSSALDKENAEKSLAWVVSDLRKRRAAGLIITHDDALAHRFCDRVVKLDQRNVHRDTAIPKRSGRRSKIRPGTPALLTARQVSLRYGRTKPFVFRNISLDIHSGELVGLFGPSGIGKTSLLRVLAGLAHPTHGDVERSGAVERSGIQVLFQSPEAVLNPYRSLAESMNDIWRYGCGGGPGRDEAVLGVMDACNLSPSLLKSRPSQLSGGQRQRAAIAQLLLVKPRILLADEPSSNLDHSNGKIVFDVFRKLTTDYATGCMIISHDQQMLNEHCDRIFEMKQPNAAFPAVTEISNPSAERPYSPATFSEKSGQR